MPEHQATGAHPQDAGVLGLGQRVQPAAEQRLGQLEVHRGRHHGQLLDGVAAVRAQPAQPGQHRVGHGDRDRGPRGGQRLGDVERVAAAQLVQHPGVPGPVPSGVPDQLDHRVGGQRLERQPGHRHAGQRPEQPARRVLGRHRVVAVGQHQDGGQPLQPAGQVGQHVHGGVVDPVQVLDQEHVRRRPAQLLDHRRVDPVGAPGPQRGLQLPPGAGRGVAQWAQRARGDQVVAAAAEHLDPTPGALDELAHQGGLADAGLPGHQHGRSPSTGRPAHRGVQRVQRGVPLQQHPPPAADGGRPRRPLSHGLCHHRSPMSGGMRHDHSRLIPPKGSKFSSASRPTWRRRPVIGQADRSGATDTSGIRPIANGRSTG